jgi:hypothetical protein
MLTLEASSASFDHAHAVIQVLDDLEGSVDAGGFGKRFHDGIESLLEVDNLENLLVSTLRVSRVADV